MGLQLERQRMGEGGTDGRGRGDVVLDQFVQWISPGPDPAVDVEPEPFVAARRGGVARRDPQSVELQPCSTQPTSHGSRGGRLPGTGGPADQHKSTHQLSPDSNMVSARSHGCGVRLIGCCWRRVWSRGRCWR
ncbi:hypothetical protein, partial [uncultured Friedmanniella sp.]|uniref:hypothetical protein n=1 Tax=uncultured Friedmanniella sp. TaxID=335381 RepID=UPI0035CBA8F6